jgi:DNA-binding GntR family transcriptional regulator
LTALADRFDVSASSITRAVRILRGEGLVASRGRRGMIVIRAQ